MNEIEKEIERERKKERRDSWSKVSQHFKELSPSKDLFLLLEVWLMRQTNWSMLIS